MISLRRRPTALLAATLIAGLLFVLTTRAQETPPARVPAPVMSFHGADWLERPSRMEEERPLDVIAYMDLKPGMIVVDLGCGSFVISGMKMERGMSLLSEAGRMRPVPT